MREDEGFTLSGVVISFFNVAGGIVLALIARELLKLTGDLALYSSLGAGSFVGGFLAARASRGKSALAPAIGGLLTVAAIVAMVAVTPVGEIVWKLAKEDAMRIGTCIGVTVFIGAMLGAAISTALLGDSTRSSIPWLFYVAFAVFGACFLAYGGTLAIVFRDHAADGMQSEEAVHELAMGFLISTGVGCLLAGVASGAAARTRILIVSILGGGGSCLGFIALMDNVGGRGHTNEELTALLVIAGGGAIVTCLGAAIGWAAFGRRGLV